MDKLALTPINKGLPLRPKRGASIGMMKGKPMPQRNKPQACQLRHEVQKVSFCLACQEKACCCAQTKPHS